MAKRRSSRMSLGLAGTALVAALGVGCAHSEDEWQAKLREVSDLKAEIDREKGSSKKALADGDEKLTRLERELRAAGIDPANVAPNAEAQARALEEHRRHAEQLEAAKKRFALLREKLAPFAKDGLAVVVRNNRIVIRLPGDTLFDNGRETLRRDGKELLSKVAEVLRNDKGLAARSWQIAGHVESGKPGGAFKDAWGMSAMRAREVVAFLVQPQDKGGGGLAAGRWSAAGYGDADPIDPGDSAEAKKQNRRCEIVAVPNVEETIELKDLGR
ncbi:Flagellar motor rotation protein MotB [Minicystis rosea]|nr:Flagellar motor rotation protein MotB [Minicystis rosea]